MDNKFTVLKPLAKKVDLGFRAFVLVIEMLNGKELMRHKEWNDSKGLRLNREDAIIDGMAMITDIKQQASGVNFRVVV